MPMKIPSKDIQRSLILGTTVGIAVFVVITMSHYLFPGIPQESITFVGVVTGSVLGGLVASSLKKK